MRFRLFWGLGALSVGWAPALAQAQAIGGAVHVGTLGLGAQIAVRLGTQVNARAGIDFQPVAIETDLSDVNYELGLPSPSLSALLDWHPGGVGFRFSGGLVYFANEMELDATPLEPVEIGSQEYQPSEIGTLIGGLGTAKLAPYLGIGWGNEPAEDFGFSTDLGVGFHGSPDAHLRATGPIGNDPQFQAELDRELDEVNDEISSLTVYPILRLGVSFGF